MHSVDVLHAIAVITLGFVAIRGLQSLGEHYFPGSEATAVARFIYGGP